MRNVRRLSPLRLPRIVVSLSTLPRLSPAMSITVANHCSGGIVNTHQLLVVGFMEIPNASLFLVGIDQCHGRRDSCSLRRG